VAEQASTMKRDDIYKTIEDFLNLVDKGTVSIEENEERLSLVLDQLAFGYHYITYNFDNKEYPEAPEQDSKTLRQLIVTRFPNYGYYNSPDEFTSNIAETKVVVGDAIDDILDITIELKDVMWCWQNTSIDDALWHFKNGFDTHWGLHLRELQLYLLTNSRGQ